MLQHTKRISIFLTIAVSTLLIAPALTASAQPGLDDGGLRFGTHDETGKVSFLGTSPGKPVPVPGADAPGLVAPDRAMAAINQYGEQFGINNPGQQLTVSKSQNPGKGRTTVKYQQVHQGIPVMGGELIVNMTERGELLSMSGEISPDLTLPVDPAFTADQAFEQARGVVVKSYGADSGSLTVSSPELWIFDEQLLLPSNRPAELVWRMEVVSTDGSPLNVLVLVNAERGGISLHFNQLDTFWYNVQDQQMVTENIFLSEQPSELRSLVISGDLATYDANNGTTLPGTFVCDETLPNCTSGTDLHADAAHKYAGQTHNFYQTYHGRDSINGAGMQVVSSVHFDSGYNNAYWSGTQMVYGDGAGYPLADDVVGHELTHGVTQYESALFYYYQSGAINESLSDVWGEFVDQVNGAGDDSAGVKWLMGEDVAGLGALRSMSNPPTYGDPDKMTSANYFLGNGEWYANDNGGVHYNSGVNNKAVYLMTDGGSFNGFTITGLGIDKVAAIYYEVQTGLLTSGADYKDLYYAVYQGCLNTVGGAEEITIPDCTEVQKALDAVEMNQEPVANYNPEAALCPAGTTVTDIFYDGFESGLGNWTIDNGVMGTEPVWINYPWYAANGTYSLYGLDYQGIDAGAHPGVVSSAAINTNITIPASGTTYLHFNHVFGFEDPNWDGGWLEYSDNGGSSWLDAGSMFNSGKNYNGTISSAWTNPNGGHAAFVGDSHGYVSSRYNISALVGQNDIRFRWKMSTDDDYWDVGWLIDDVRVYQCAAVTCNPLTLTHTGNGSDPVASPANSTECSAGQYVAGENITLTASPDPGWGIFGWTGTDNDANGASSNTMTMPAGAHAASVTIAPELFTNTSFETDLPDGWMFAKNTESVDGRDCTTSKTGSCGWELNGNDVEKRIVYHYRPDGLAGDSFDFSVWRKGANTAGTGYIIAEVLILHQDLSKEKQTIYLAPGDQSLWEQKVASFTATEDYQLIVVSVIYKKPGGTLWVDDISLVKNGSTELMQTASFETVIPNNWMFGKNTEVVDGRDCTVPRAGSCGWALNGNDVEKRIVYHYRPDGLAGDSFDFSVWRKGANTAGTGYIIAEVLILHQDLSKEKQTIYLAPGDQTQWEQKQANFTATEDYQLIVVSVIYKKPGGTLWVDDISLVKGP